MLYETDVITFIELANKHNVRMLLVGGGAVNFHGYQRHSADVDFWIDTTKKNIAKLIEVFQEMGFEISELPADVKNGDQNISIKFSPYQTLELISRFNPNKTFEEAWKDAVVGEIRDNNIARYRVLSLEDLVISKIKSGRPKDLLDIQELQRINKA
jgi:hypothetical protein